MKLDDGTRPTGDRLEPEPEKAAGLVCPVCGCRHFLVLEMRPAQAGYIRRRRQCRHCGKRVTTSERIIG